MNDEICTVRKKSKVYYIGGQIHFGSLQMGIFLDLGDNKFLSSPCSRVYLVLYAQVLIFTLVRQSRRTIDSSICFKSLEITAKRKHHIRHLLNLYFEYG